MGGGRCGQAHVSADNGWPRHGWHSAKAASTGHTPWSAQAAGIPGEYPEPVDPRSLGWSPPPGWSPPWEEAQEAVRAAVEACAAEWTAQLSVDPDSPVRDAEDEEGSPSGAAPGQPDQQPAYVQHYSMWRSLWGHTLQNPANRQHLISKADVWQPYQA